MFSVLRDYDLSGPEYFIQSTTHIVLGSTWCSGKYPHMQGMFVCLCICFSAFGLRRTGCLQQGMHDISLSFDIWVTWITIFGSSFPEMNSHLSIHKLKNFLSYSRATQAGNSETLISIIIT